MADKPQTVTGEVISVTEWKSQKGSWVNLKDNPNDFFAYSGKVPAFGSTGTWTVKEGTGHMSDKVELVKLVGDLELKAKIKAAAKEEVKEMENLIDKGDKVYFDKQNLIIRQVCIKAAATAVGGAAVVEKSKDWPVVGDRICEVADKLYAWVMESDNKLPEPPEEP